MSYLSQFLSLKSASDILAASGPINNPIKEISESMAVIRPLRKFFFRLNTDILENYTVIDLCAGNCLTGLIIAHLFKCNTISVDKKRPQKLNEKNVQRYKFIEEDLKKFFSSLDYTKSLIFISSHPCQLAFDIIKQAITCGVKFSILPCCLGKGSEFNDLPSLPLLCEQKMSKYEQWCLKLALYGRANVYKDLNCLSSKNCVVTNLR